MLWSLFEKSFPQSVKFLHYKKSFCGTKPYKQIWFPEAFYLLSF